MSEVDRRGPSARGSLAERNAPIRSIRLLPGHEQVRATAHDRGIRSSPARGREIDGRRAELRRRVKTWIRVGEALLVDLPIPDEGELEIARAVCPHGPKGNVSFGARNQEGQPGVIRLWLLVVGDAGAHLGPHEA